MSESPEQFKARMDARYTRDGSYGPLPIIRVITEPNWSRGLTPFQQQSHERLEAVAADMREAEIEWAYADRDDHAHYIVTACLTLIGEGKGV